MPARWSKQPQKSVNFSEVMTMQQNQPRPEPVSMVIGKQAPQGPLAREGSRPKGQKQGRQQRQRSAPAPAPAPSPVALPVHKQYKVEKTGMMTVKEVEGLIRQQLNSLCNPNPYVDDYYQYAMLCAKALERVGRGGSSIALPGILPAGGSTMLNGGNGKAIPKHVVKSLGKIAKWSANTPRQLLSNISAPPEPPSTELDTNMQEAPPIEAVANSTPPSGPDASSDRQFPLRVRGKIEDAMCLLYKLEEFDRAEQLPDSAGPAVRTVSALRLLILQSNVNCNACTGATRAGSTRSRAAVTSQEAGHCVRSAHRRNCSHLHDSGRHSRT